MNALAEFKDHYKHLDEMIAESTKADLAECARLLALNVAHYKAKYGELPLEEHPRDNIADAFMDFFARTFKDLKASGLYKAA